MKKYLVEFIGTFFLVLVIGLTVLQGVAAAPVAIGTVLMVMVYMGGHISGGHYNPAVTLAMLVNQEIDAKDGAMYMLFQILGAAIAAMTAAFLVGKTLVVAPGADVGIAQALVNEILFTFALVIVIFNVAVHPRTQGNSYYGLAIGFTVLAAAYAGGGISGGAYNPAVGIGPIIVDTIHGGSSIGNIWIYIVGPCVGGVLAAFVYNFTKDA